MYLPLGKYSPDVKIGLVSASRNCFPRSLSETRTKKLLAELKKLGITPIIPEGKSSVIESNEDAKDAAAQLKALGCDAAILYLGNFSPEIEDANFVKNFDGLTLIMAAAEENAKSLACDRGDALCGLLSATMGINKRGLWNKIIIPENPVVNFQAGAKEAEHFIKVVKVVKGIRNATIGLFGPRPRDFETCNYNVASLLSIGVEVEELGLFDLHGEVERIKKEELSTLSALDKENSKFKAMPKDGFVTRLSAYEKALKNFREKLKLSGAASQCWIHQETACGHVPCLINAKLNEAGFPVACETDAYSLVAELMSQYASNDSVTMLDLNHSIPADLHSMLKKYDINDVVGLFHCGNTAPKRVKDAQVKYQVIMHRGIEPNSKPDLTRGTYEGMIKASPITAFQIHGSGDKLRAYICEGEFLNIDPKTFGSTGTAYIPGFRRFYRHCLLGKFHHHAAIAFEHCGAVLFDALKALGIEEIYTPQDAPYAGENTFRK